MRMIVAWYILTMLLVGAIAAVAVLWCHLSHLKRYQGPLLFALTGAFVGDTRAAGTLLLARCEAGFAYGLLFGLAVFPVLPWLVASRQGSSLRRLRRRVRR